MKAPSLVHKVEPALPALKGRIEGGVSVLEAVIDRKGNVKEISIVEAYRPEFDAAFVQAIRLWKYQPATLRGEPVCVRIMITALPHFI